MSADSNSDSWTWLNRCYTPKKLTPDGRPKLTAEHSAAARWVGREHTEEAADPQGFHLEGLGVVEGLGV